MSTPAEMTTEMRTTGSKPWSLWIRQTLAIMRLEIKKNFFSRRALLLYPVVGLPLFLLTMLAIFPPDTDEMGNFACSARFMRPSTAV